MLRGNEKRAMRNNLSWPLQREQWPLIKLQGPSWVSMQKHQLWCSQSIVCFGCMIGGLYTYALRIRKAKPLHRSATSVLTFVVCPCNTRAWRGQSAQGLLGIIYSKTPLLTCLPRRECQGECYCCCKSSWFVLSEHRLDGCALAHPRNTNPVVFYTTRWKDVRVNQ
jgi:hypothetical protein